MDLVHYLQSTDGKSWLSFWCPGCKHPHAIPFINAPQGAPGLWAYDGKKECPTITPSLRVMAGSSEESQCHVVVTSGILNYCSDCKHSLAGKSVPMVDFKDNWYEEP